DLRRDRIERFVELGELHQHSLRGAQAVDNGAFFFIKGTVNSAGTALNFLEIGKQARARIELIELARDELRIINFLRLEFVELELLATQGARGLELRLLRHERLAALVEVGEFAAKIRRAAELIDDG